MPFPFQVDDSLNSLTQSIQPCTNVAIVIEDFIGSSRVNCVYMAFNKNKSVLPDLSIIVNLSKCEKAPHSSFYEDEWFLDSDVSTHFTLFESDFVNMTLGNYGWVETANLKAPLFMVAFGTILIEHEIFDPEKETTKVAVLKL